MSLARLLLRNLLYHWRGNLAVCLGVMVGSAVLTGALLVGDSLRGSLRERTLRRLGWVDHALVGGRLLREKLAGELKAGHICPALLLQGAAGSGDDKKPNSLRRVGRVMILGVDERFWPNGEPPLGRDFWRSREPGVVLNATLARELEVEAGDKVTLYFQKVSAVPRESLLGRRGAADVLADLELPVQAVLPDDDPAARFSLSPNPEAPRNAFVPLSVLQAKLERQERVNALLVSGPGETLPQQLRERLTLDDWDLVLAGPAERGERLFRYLDPEDRDGKLTREQWFDAKTKTNRLPDELVTQAGPEGTLTRAQVVEYYRSRHPYLSLESRQMLLEDAVASAAREAAKQTGLTAAPTLVYLADTIAAGKHEVPYSVVAALDPRLPPPLGPFLPPGFQDLGDDGIILVDWRESPLPARLAEPVTLTYYQVTEQGRLEQRKAGFFLLGKLPLAGPADDPFLTPEFPGITDRLDIGGWVSPPFPYESKRIQPRDERYWHRYRTSPKAYITLAKGQQLWGSRFGKVTSIRLAPSKDGDLERAAGEFRRALLAWLDPAEGGLVFDAVRERGLRASEGGMDFGQLFLYFSFFLIVAALLLVGLLCRLNLDRRAAEVGVLFAAGYRRSTVRRLLLAEGSLLAALGALAGCVLGVAYCGVLLWLLRLLWPGGLDRSFLKLHAWPWDAWSWSFVIGYFGALVVSALTIAWAVRVMGRASPRALLAGTTADESEPGGASRRSGWSVWLALGSAAGALVLAAVGGLVRDHEVRAGTFFGSGALLLTAGLAGVWTWMRGARHVPVHGHGTPALSRLGARNAARNPVRSLLTAGLLASSAFLLVAVESFRRQPGHDFLQKESGSGGFALLAESDVPIYQDLNSEQGRGEVIEGLETRLQARTDLSADDRARELERAETLLGGIQFFPFRVKAGDDASCLNLYQPRRPRLLGAPAGLIERGGFRFAASEAITPEEQANPWLLLHRPPQDGAIPVIGEQNTVTWMLKKKLGDVIKVPDEKDEKGRLLRLRIVGLLKDSVFQSGLLMSEASFLERFPGQGGYNFFLIDTAAEPPEQVKDLLQTALAPRGLEVESTARRLESYLAVENTYLSTFQVLGGLGLLLGALGLAVVLLRGVWERRGELALLRALGFRHGALGWLVLAENAFLLALGLGAGTLAALLAVAPHLIAGEGQVSWPTLLGLLGVVLLVGLTAGAVAVAATLRAPLVPALRRE